jgi:hypothetical protein
LATNLSLTNRALSMLGAETIGSFTASDSPQAAIAVELYQSTIDQHLSEWDWRFAVQRRQLSEVAEPLPAGSPWSHQYAIPTNCLRFIKTDLAQGRWEIYAAPTGDEGGQLRLYSDEREVWADRVIRQEAALMPAHFQKAAELRLAAVLAMPITRNRQVADYYLALASAAVAQAKAIDWNSQPWPEIEGGRMLADARFGG